MPWKTNSKNKGSIWQYTLVMLTVYMMIPLSNEFAIWDEKPLPTSIYEPIWWVVSFFQFHRTCHSWCLHTCVRNLLGLLGMIFFIWLLLDLELSWCEQWPIHQKKNDKWQRQCPGGCEKWKRFVKWTFRYHTVGWFRNPAPSCRGSFHSIIYKVLYIPGYLSTWCRILLPPHSITSWDEPWTVEQKPSYWDVLIVRGW